MIYQKVYMRNYSYSPSPYSSQRHSRSPTPRHPIYPSRPKSPAPKSSNYSKSKPNLNQTIHNIITAIIFFLIILLIYLISSTLSPPSHFCPNGATCSSNNFTCNDQSQVKFYGICHKPGNFFKTEDLSLLFKYQCLLYDFVESQKGQATVSNAVEANLHLKDNASTQLDANDIEIIWTYDQHYFIDDDNVLRFHPSPMIFITLYSIVIITLIAILYYANYKFFS